MLSRVFTVALHRNVVTSIYCGSTQECCHEYLLWLYTGMLSQVFTVALHRNVVTSIYCGSTIVNNRYPVTSVVSTMFYSELMTLGNLTLVVQSVGDECYI